MSILLLSRLSVSGAPDDPAALVIAADRTVFRQSPMPTLSAPRRMKMRSRGMLLYTPARRGRVTLVPKSPTGSLT